VEAAGYIASQIVDDAIELAYLGAALGSLEGVMARNPEVDHIIDEAQERLIPRFRTRLIAIAGNLRNFVFENKPQRISEEEWSQATERTVGRFHSSDGEKDLLLKDACNRIVHAKVLEPAVVARLPASTAHPRFSVVDCVFVSGELHRNPWNALVNIPQFSTAAYA
jgi:hypothetical protein